MSENPPKPSPEESPDSANGPSKIAGALRPLAKEMIKGGLLTFSAISGSLAGVGKQFTDLVDEAKAELAKKEDSPQNNSSKDSSP